MSEFKLSELLNISIQRAKTIINNFFKIIPKVNELLRTLGWVGTHKGYIRTLPPFRRIRWFPQWHKELLESDDWNAKKILGEIERAAKNTPIQGTNGDVTKLALYMMQDYIDSNNLPVNILLAIYDEIQTECREDYAEQWKKELERIMIEAAKVVIKRIPIKADVKVSDCWTK